MYDADRASAQCISALLGARAPGNTEVILAVSARKPVRKRLRIEMVALRYRLLNNRLVDSSLLDNKFFDIRLL